jgi:hypothetical protein
MIDALEPEENFLYPMRRAQFVMYFLATEFFAEKSIDNKR